MPQEYGRVGPASVASTDIADGSVGAIKMDSNGNPVQYVPVADGSGGVIWAVVPFSISGLLYLHENYT